MVDLDSTVTEVYGKTKHGASYGYTGVLGYHPLIATRAGTGEILGSRMRKGAAGSSRGVLRFIGELLATIGRAGVSGPVTVRADSAFWSWKLVDKLTRVGVGWSITVRLVPKIKATIAAIPEENWTTIDYTRSGHAQVAETIYTTGTGKRTRQVRLVVRRTRLADTTQTAMWPLWRHHAFICTTPSLPWRPTGSTATTLWSSSPSANSKTTGSNTASGSFAANGAWLACGPRTQPHPLGRDHRSRRPNPDRAHHPQPAHRARRSPRQPVRHPPPSGFPPTGLGPTNSAALHRIRALPTAGPP
ncbi:MAG: transposase [Candidatus Microthrix sp.]|nr:transposase [Candidatus Microthrix sp.]